ncbi:retinol dehydrogenase 13 isoform X1 [Zeugodacus cucurbitae]|uniref:NADP-retinol dehydrogenase n=1 Tax=Zeugodacus cucurbitae TaxID=28588 RepID=A0A0A1X931_ZEUCU|nr:retinol dehydrogenase 13 isoform X1 [Zeugodacus cucurbitae]
MFSFLKSRPVFWASVTGTTVGVAFFIKDLMQGEMFKNPIRAENKVVIVTGANTGIGKETVRELANRGATIYMACRDMQKCEEARDELVLESSNKHIYCRHCDLASMDSVRKFVDGFKKEQERLDILINNAGVMRCPRSSTKDGFEMQLGVNHMGHFLLTNLLLDLLKKSVPSRIVTVSSLAHTRGEINTGDLNSDKAYNPGRAYNQSKLANILFTRELAKRLEGTGVSANALHPGVVDTELFRHMGFFNSFFANLFFKPLFWPFIKSAKNGAQTTLYVALDPELANVSGKYFSDCNLKDVAPAAMDDALAKWLWAVSEKWTKLSK